MNFLQMVQALKREAGVSGDIVTVSNQRGEADRLVNWVANSYLEICNEEQGQWKFLRKQVVKDLTPGIGVYSAADFLITDMDHWDETTCRVALMPDLSDENYLEAMQWNEFYDYWLFGSRRTLQGQPLNASVGTDDRLNLAPIPSGPYKLAFEYNALPTPLAADEDVPLMPSKFHMLIVWRALRHYGMFESAPEVVARAEDAMNELQFRLMLEQTNQVTLGGPLC